MMAGNGGNDEVQIFRVTSEWTIILEQIADFALSAFGSLPLCRLERSRSLSKDDEVVEYALSRTLSPALIAEYQTQLRAIRNARPLDLGTPGTRVIC
jgi:hypothetical protein